MIDIRCSKCDQKFSRRVRQQRRCEDCQRPARKSAHQAKLTTSRALDLIVLGDRISGLSSQVKGTKNEASLTRMVSEARKAAKVPDLVAYARHITMAVEDTLAGDPWSRSDQLRIFGAIWCKAYDATSN